jgi:hypothetical protein
MGYITWEVMATQEIEFFRRTDVQNLSTAE